MSKADLALEHVQNLYMLQIQLFQILDSDVRSPRDRRQALEHVKRFQSLLRKADHRYMGGEDVVASLKQLPVEVTAKIAPRRARTLSRIRQRRLKR
ncbi:hypothetical protein HY285_03130 [Candidatus Peregrinibacteria bacterium]|nr:hypothetical protein [Candidatus Peregrinibacteria bacterium]MBI3816509.1 hypothetical protein [Candidatus Peregrinibacteria bacterium]